MRVESLERPKEGSKNTITLANGLRFVNVISQKFTCPKCNTFCGELIPVLDGKTRAWMRRTRRTLMSPELQVKVFCYAGCHNQPGWGWNEFNWDSVHDRNRIEDWPSEWRHEDRLAWEKKTREANDRAKKGE